MVAFNRRHISSILHRSTPVLSDRYFYRLFLGFVFEQLFFEAKAYECSDSSFSGIFGDVI